MAIKLQIPRILCSCYSLRVRVAIQLVLFSNQVTVYFFNVKFKVWSFESETSMDTNRNPDPLHERGCCWSQFRLVRIQSLSEGPLAEIELSRNWFLWVLVNCKWAIKREEEELVLTLTARLAWKWTSHIVSATRLEINVNHFFGESRAVSQNITCDFYDLFECSSVRWPDFPKFCQSCDKTFGQVLRKRFADIDRDLCHLHFHRSRMPSRDVIFTAEKILN